MNIFEVMLDGKQYAKLEKMLIADRVRKLAMNQPISGYELFCDMIDDIYSPVTDGWSTLDILLKESNDKLDLLKFMTKQVFPNDEYYFVRQIGNPFQCRKDFEFKISLIF